MSDSGSKVSDDLGPAETPLVGGADRLAQPADAEGDPRLPFTVVGIGASAGGLEAYIEFLQGSRPDSGMAFVLVQHLSPKHESVMAELLAKHTTMPVLQVADGMKVEPNHVYVIRPGFTMTIHGGHLHLGESAAERGHRRPVDDFFRSLAEEQRQRAICVIVSGTGSNGTAGAQSVKAVGGICIAQDPETAKFPSMPRSLIESGMADAVLRPGEMFEAIAKFASHPYSASTERSPAALAAADGQWQSVNEVIAILRSRVRHDFSGYKRPTLIRRMQRRMSLLQIQSAADYVSLLRENPAEVTSLADDMLIHVTGFFRDPEVWQALRDHVIAPLVAAKPDGGTVRAWVTACSSGEEAYTLAILLLEAAEASGKRLDIKVFATDAAERSLTQARAGYFPGGIESDILPARIDRFFDKDEAFYRVKKELRELVVFAPQNLLQDPPFSRLDICTCRNLLIYIQPDVQRRVLSLLHFGLVEGGTLLLGSSETVTGAESLFLPVDKRHRIFRRVGPTRYGSIEFPVSSDVAKALTRHPSDGLEEPSRVLPESTLAHLTSRLLLEKFTPAAVVVSRQGEIVYYHGNTGAFLNPPKGGPTNDLFTLVREEIRGAVRAAFQRAVTQGNRVEARDGILGEGEDRTRVIIHVAPLEPRTTSTYFLVGFERRPEQSPSVSTPSAQDSASSELADELRRVRDELQSTVEELQTSNEEMKASHEEVTSINEELQSSNEELETSKEELQSLNEELTTVNSQLQSKMEEIERASNDLSSLLSSTNIAVIFLDRQFRIRRFTPAVRDLLDPIASDIGRPLKDLARKFTDPQLSADVETVLHKLAPIEREIVAEGNRSFLRRITPYRTADDRIDGIVITFIDITDRKRVEEALQESEQRLAGEARALTRLHELVSRLITSRDVKAALEETLVAVMELLGADMGFVQLFDVEQRRMSLVAHRGIPAEMVDRIQRSAVGDAAVTGRVGHALKRVVVSDARSGESSALVGVLLASPEIGSGQSTPLVSPGGDLLGTLSTCWREPHEPTDRELRILDLYVRQAADFIERTRFDLALRQSEERYRNLFTAMDEAFAIMEALHDASGNVVDFRYIETNPSFARLTGIEAPVGGAVRGTSPRLDEEWIQRFALVLQSGEPLRFNGHMHSADRWVEVFASRVGGPESRKVALLFTDVTDRRNAERAIEHAREVAEAANRVKDDFMATLSHELRTPLSSVLLWSKILSRSAAVRENEELREGLEAIVSGAEAQKQLIDDLLDSARIISGKLQLNMQDVPLAEAVEKAVNAILPIADAKTISIVKRIQEDAGVVRADPDRLGQVVWNVLTNAVKFTPEGGRVEIALERDGDDVTVRVTDTGRGMTSEFLTRAFDRFVQADGPHTRSTGGLGLGLAIARQIVEMHGGTISAESPGLGEGSTFTIRMRLPEVPSHRPTRGEPASPRAPNPLRDLRILLVEDDAGNAGAVVRLLVREGAVVSHHGTAAGAFEEFTKQPPDVLLSDIGLPDVDGYALMRKIRQWEADRAVRPVLAIALTAFARDADRARALEVGFDTHLGKPVEPKNLVETIESLVQDSRRRMPS